MGLGHNENIWTAFVLAFWQSLVNVNFLWVLYLRMLSSVVGNRLICSLFCPVLSRTCCSWTASRCCTSFLAFSRVPTGTDRVYPYTDSNANHLILLISVLAALCQGVQTCTELLRCFPSCLAATVESGPLGYNVLPYFGSGIIFGPRRTGSDQYIK